jgi:hypothetical protein
LAAHDPAVRRLAAQKAAQSRWNEPTHETASALAEAQLASYIKRILADAPFLKDHQRQRLAVLLAGGHKSSGEVR